MSVLRVLFVGPLNGTAYHRFQAFKRLGHVVTAFDPYLPLNRFPFLSSWAFRTGAFGVSGLVTRAIQPVIKGKVFDLAWIECGDVISAHCVSLIRSASKRAVLYNIDNPFVPRDGGRWRSLHKALPYYDLFVSPRDQCLREAIALGVKQVLRLNMSADEVVHKKAALTVDDIKIYGSDVAFVGTWMPEREPFLLDLIERGVPLRIFGPRWDRGSSFHLLRQFTVNSLLPDAEYVKALSAAKIGLALLSKGNRDLHTTRSFEIPAIGTLLCAERTADHKALYRENEEAVFWSNPAECADLCHMLLGDEARREEIAAAGHRRVIANHSFNEPSISRVLELFGFDGPAAAPGAGAH